MTNGEKIQQMFPNAEIGYGLRGVVAVTFIHKTIFDLDWWNAEYKEPTAKNDLEGDCISRKAVLNMAKSYNTDGWDSYTPLVVDVEDIETLPSVTPQEPRWIPVKTRKLTDAEEQDMLENSAYYFNYMFDCQLPEDGEEVLITTSTGEVTTTTFYDEGLDGCCFEFYEDDGDVIAWMAKPNGYKTEEGDKE